MERFHCSLPGLSWDAALKDSEVRVELITDIDMYLVIEMVIRRGISMISHRYANIGAGDEKFWGGGDDLTRI